MPTNRSSVARQAISPQPGLDLSAIPNLKLSNSPLSKRRCLAEVVYSVARHNRNRRILNSRHLLHVCLKYQISVAQLTDCLFSIRRGSNSWPDYRHRTLWWRGPVRQHDWSTAAAATHTATTFPARWIRTIRRQQTRGACWVFVWGRSKSTAGDRCTTTRAFRWFHAWPNQPFTVDVGRRVVW